jgi:ubiquinol-cytochrome c reductase iron-sulfur subunit
MTGGRFIYASAIRLAVLKFVLSMSATADVLALASLEVDLGKIEPGQTVTVKWRGKPVFIRRRTAAEIAREAAVAVKDLRDQQADSERTVNPEWLIVVGVCTHLGCVPLPGAGDYNGWFCPWCVARLAQRAPRCARIALALTRCVLAATGAITTPAAASARAPRPTTWRCQNTNFSMRTRCSLVRLRPEGMSL